jgi:hypothetical protein
MRIVTDVTAFLAANPWLGVLIGMVFGSGALWSFLQFWNARQAHKVNAAKVIADLQRELGDKLVRLIELSNQYAKLRDAEARSGPTRESPSRGNEMRRLQAQIDLVKQDIPLAEARLAKLEGRAPRQIQLQWIPPAPPTGLRIVGVTFQEGERAGPEA